MMPSAMSSSIRVALLLGRLLLERPVASPIVELASTARSSAASKSLSRVRAGGAACSRQLPLRTAAGVATTASASRRAPPPASARTLQPWSSAQACAELSAVPLGLPRWPDCSGSRARLVSHSAFATAARAPAQLGIRRRRCRLAVPPVETTSACAAWSFDFCLERISSSIDCATLRAACTRRRPRRARLPATQRAHAACQRSSIRGARRPLRQARLAATPSAARRLGCSSDRRLDVPRASRRATSVPWRELAPRALAIRRRRTPDTVMTALELRRVNRGGQRRRKPAAPWDGPRELRHAVPSRSSPWRRRRRSSGGGGALVRIIATSSAHLASGAHRRSLARLRAIRRRSSRNSAARL